MNWVIGYGFDREEAEAFKNQLLEAVETILYYHIQDIELEQIGATIAVHTGPYPLGIGLLHKAP